jgi:hypothetical protein
MNGSSLARCGESVRQHSGSSELETQLNEVWKTLPSLAIQLTPLDTRQLWAHR